MRAEKQAVEMGEIKAKIAEFYDSSVWHFVYLNGLFENNERKFSGVLQN